MEALCGGFSTKGLKDPGAAGLERLRNWRKGGQTWHGDVPNPVLYRDAHAPATADVAVAPAYLRTSPLGERQHVL